MRIRDALRCWLVFVAVWLSCSQARAGEVRIAVAANFIAPMKEIIRQFEDQRDCKVIASYTSTGTLYAQIVNGAPFDILMAADKKRPEMLERQGRSVVDSRFTYAIGRLVLMGAADREIDTLPVALASENVRHLALSNPKTAPYGLAARQVIESLDLTAALTPKLVYGNNVSQTYQLVDSGSAQLGFVAYSQIVSRKQGTGGAYRIVSQALHDPIAQQAVLLTKGADNPCAQYFMSFLASPPVAAIIRTSGYSVE